MDNKHTPEPWKIDQDDRPGMSWNNHIVSAANPNIAISFMTHDGTTENETGEANARRIVACVNACAGITNEQLDNISMISGSVAGRFAEQKRYLDQVEKQRDELLAALKKCRQQLSAWMRDHGDDIATQEAVSDARAAIASVEAQP